MVRQVSAAWYCPSILNIFSQRHIKYSLTNRFGGAIIAAVNAKAFTGVVMADKTYEMTLLYDFFGELLTEKQREYFEYYYNDDLSLSEIAEITGISRQGARDNIVRAEKLLLEYEEKTGVVARFQEMSRTLAALSADAERLQALTEGEACKLAARIHRGLNDLKG